MFPLTNLIVFCKYKHILILMALTVGSGTEGKIKVKKKYYCHG